MSVDDHPIAGQRCLVLGAGGFIGTNLCRLLRRLGASVRAFGRAPKFPRDLDGVEWLTGSSDDQAALASALESQEIVFNLLGSSTPASSGVDLPAELLGATADILGVLEQSRLAGVRRMVFASSGGTIYGSPASLPIAETTPPNPLSAYALGKLIAEGMLALYERLYGIDGIVLRIGNPYGPFQTAARSQGIVAATFMRGLRAEPVVIWGDGQAVRDFIYIDDACEAFAAAAVYRGPLRVFNVGSGIGRSINSVVDDIERLLSPRRLTRDHRASRPVDVPANVLDNSLMIAELGIRPRTDWAHGLGKTYEWLRDCTA